MRIMYWGKVTKSSITIPENARIKLNRASSVSSAEHTLPASHSHVNYVHTVIFHNLYLIQ